MNLSSTARAAALALLVAMSVVAPVAHAGSPADAAMSSATATSSDRFIVKFRDGGAEPRAQIAAVGQRNGRTFEYLRAMSGGAHVVRIPQGAGVDTSGRDAPQASRLLALQLMNDPAIAYIEPDHRLHPLVVPNDPMYSAQWNYYEAAGGINLPAAWNVTTGSASIVTAVIDTGIRPHVELVGRYVQGYDFIGDTTVSNDGDGRDSDASDPGDYCNGTRSSWHGTHVAGTIGAASNNGVGVSGVNWVSKILPARVLGVCGGYTSDIADAIRWSAGIAVAGVPVNANPARVENMSLGGSQPCSNTMQSAITDAIARGTVIVVAAGNENADAANSQPASCNGVIAVGALNRDGSRASYSNYGAKVAISAPGSGILSTLNDGTNAPGADSYAYLSGTSMATPHVAGVVSLMLSVNPALTPADVKTRLTASARAFPTNTASNCTTAVCGAGVVDAGAAVAAAGASATSRFDIASQSNGSVAVASSTTSASYAASGANDSDHRGVNWGSGGGWQGATANGSDDEMQVRFNGMKTVSEIDVYTLQDDYTSLAEPTTSTPFSLYGLTAFDVQYWNGSSWATVPGGSVTGNNKVWSKFTFSPVSTPVIRVVAHAGIDGRKRVVEIEAYNDATALNVALPANGGKAVASSSAGSGYPASGADDGDRRGLNWGAGGGWAGSTPNGVDDELQIGLNAMKTISEIDVFTLQDNLTSPVDPTLDLVFTKYGLTDFDVQYWGGSSWVTVPGGGVTGNNKVWRKFTFPAVTTPAIRVLSHKGIDGTKRIVEVEAYLAQ